MIPHIKPKVAFIEKKNYEKKNQNGQLKKSLSSCSANSQHFSRKIYGLVDVKGIGLAQPTV